MNKRSKRMRAMTMGVVLGVCGGVVAPCAIAQEGGEDEIRLYPFDGTDPSPGGGPFDLNALFGIDGPPDPIGPDWNMQDPTAPSILWNSPNNSYQFAFGLGTDAPGDWQTTYNTSHQAGPDENGVYQFLAELEELSGISPTPFMYLVTVEVEAVEGTWDFNWAGFNPQPEPPPLDPLVGFVFDVQPASPTRVQLTVRVQNEDTGEYVPFSALSVPGDIDGDGDIDDTDLGTAFSNYTGPVGAAGGKTRADGDHDGDGDVDDSDLGAWFSGYTGPLSPASVPEPAGAALLGLAGLIVSRRRRE